MKQIKFLKTISLEGRPIWYKDCCYEVISETSNPQGRNIYKLFCEDLKLRGIDTILENNFYKVIEVKDIVKNNITNDDKQKKKSKTRKKRK